MADLKDFAEQLVNLTVKEVNELADILKNDYGIEPAAAAVAVAGPAAGGEHELVDACDFSWGCCHVLGTAERQQSLLPSQPSVYPPCPDLVLSRSLVPRRWHRALRAGILQSISESVQRDGVYRVPGVLDNECYRYHRAARLHLQAHILAHRPAISLHE